MEFEGPPNIITGVATILGCFPTPSFTAVEMRIMFKSVLVAGVGIASYRYMAGKAAMSTLRASRSSLDLTGKHALVVGGTTGIGFGIAQRLAQSNANVIIVGRNAEKGEQIVKEFNNLYDKTHRLFSMSLHAFQPHQTCIKPTIIILNTPTGDFI